MTDVDRVDGKKQDAIKESDVGRVPGLANKSRGHSVEFEFQINNKYF